MSHVAMILPGIDRLGGAERQALQLARGLRRRGWQMTVIALSGNGGDARIELELAGVDFLSLHMREGLADLQSWMRLHRWIGGNRPDLLHGHLPRAVWMARGCRLFAPIPAVIDTVHTSCCGSVRRRMGYRYSNWLADAVTAVSRGAADTHLNAGMVTRDRLVVIPNGVDTRHWKPDPQNRAALRAELGIANEFLWLTAGRMEAVKNFSSLLDAFAQMSPDARLVIAGNGPQKAELRAQTAALGLAARVTFPGFDRNLLRWMQAADAFVLPSLWEGLPMVLLEAGACGLPAVTTNVPGCRDVVLHGETGLLAPAGDTSALARTMSTLMQLDADERAAMGHNASLHVAAQFDLERVIDQWDRFYRQLLHNRKSVARLARVTPSTRDSQPAFPSQTNPPHRQPRVDSLAEP